jgi:hypothetical protein
MLHNMGTPHSLAKHGRYGLQALTFHIGRRGKVTIQPAGSARKRHVFLSLVFSEGEVTRQVELVLSQRTAKQLGNALMSGSLGVMQEFDLSSDIGE